MQVSFSLDHKCPQQYNYTFLKYFVHKNAVQFNKSIIFKEYVEKLFKLKQNCLNKSIKIRSMGSKILLFHSGNLKNFLLNYKNVL